MQLVLDDEIGWTEWIGGFRFDSREFLRVALNGRMAVGIFQLWGAPAMTRAVSIDLAEEHLRFTLPRHLREFIHSSNEQRWQAAINFFIHYHDGQTFIWRLAF